MKPTLLILMLLVCTPCFADCWQVGTCKSVNPVYDNVTFKVDECSSYEELINLTHEKKGLLIKEKDKDEYTVIYSDTVAAPETVYVECNRGFEQG